MTPEQQSRAVKRSIKDLIRMAFVWAEQDRASLADAWPKGSPERARAQADHDQLRAYRLKRWGKTGFDVMMENVKPTTLAEIVRRHD